MALRMGDFMDEEAYRAALRKAKDYFDENYNIVNCYANPRASGPMAIHLYEEQCRTNRLLEKLCSVLVPPDDEDE